MECRLYSTIRKEVASIQEVKQQAGWQITTFDLPDSWLYTEGDGVIVAVVDTGIDLNHPDLKDNLIDGYNVLRPDQPPMDRNAHGSHVAGVIAAVNNGHGVVGVAPKAQIMPIKVLDADGIGDLRDVVAGIKVALAKGADIICLSLGCGKPYAGLRKIIKTTNVPIFCAAGNIGKSYEALYPARYPETIAVAALTKDYKRADFSNTAHDNLDFLAPGVDILSTIPTAWYGIMSGSSMANAFAVSCAALALSAKRKHKLNIKLDCPNDYRNLLKDHAVDPKHGLYKGNELERGFGIIEPKSMVNFIRETWDTH